MERRALLAQNEVAEGEAKKLALQNGRLLGHQVRESLCRDILKYLSTLPEPLPEDTACGEDQTRERSVEN